METRGFLILLFFFNLISLIKNEKELFFSCKFDDASTIATNQCGGATVTNTGQTIGVLNGDTVIGANPSIYVTDVKSITGPTLNSQHSCMLPYDYNNQTYYFCYNSGLLKYSCVTTENETRECVRGNFLRIKTTGSVFQSTFTVNNAINVKQPGVYTLSFNSFIHCVNPACDSANEKIVFKIKENIEADFKEIHRVGFETGRIRDIAWNYEEILFETTTGSFNLRIELSRENAVTNGQGFLAVDEISIFKEEYYTTDFMTTKPFIDEMTTMVSNFPSPSTNPTTTTYASNSQFSNTANGCFHALQSKPYGTAITTIQFSTTKDVCCTYCRSLGNCVVWEWHEKSGSCVLYSEVTKLLRNDVNYVTGVTTTQQLWKCTEDKDKWYFQDSLNWAKVGAINSKSQCCDTCFDLYYYNGCKSWMFNALTNECFHSFANYNTTAWATFNGISTGSVLANFNRPNVKFENEFELGRCY